MTCRRSRIILLVFFPLLVYLLSACVVNPATETQIPTRTVDKLPFFPTGMATQEFASGDLATLTTQEAENLTREDIVSTLIAKWLQGYMDKADSKEGITGYEVVDVVIRSHSTEPRADIIATVTFDILPIYISNNWSVLSMYANEGHNWWREYATFDAVYEGDEVILREDFSYGT